MTGTSFVLQGWGQADVATSTWPPVACSAWMEPGSGPVLRPTLTCLSVLCNRTSRSDIPHQCLRSCRSRNCWQPESPLNIPRMMQPAGSAVFQKASSASSRARLTASPITLQRHGLHMRKHEGHGVLLRRDWQLALSREPWPHDVSRHLKARR